MNFSCGSRRAFSLHSMHALRAGTVFQRAPAGLLQRLHASTALLPCRLHRNAKLHAAQGEVGPKKPKRGSKTTPIPPAEQALAPPLGHERQPAVHKDEGHLVADLDEEEDQLLSQYMDAVVKVYCIHTEPNYSLPWQRKRQMNSTSSGFIATTDNRKWLLTNAHSVDYHTQVKVKKRGDDRKYLAKVLSIGVDCDIALLTVEDPKFWEGVQPLEFGVLPRLQDSVAVVGYPIGGDTISVTAGVVSRIEVTDYSHGSIDLLAIQIDAAINGGNSGGPVFNRYGQCVGIAFQALVGQDVENVGYVIPTPVVQHFLTDYERTGSFSGFPALGIQWQRMESEALQRAYKLKPGQKGILIRKLNPTSHAASVLKLDDIVCKFDGIEISSDGTVPFRTGERIAFSYLISNKFVGDECQLEIIRDGQTLNMTVKLSKPHQLVPPHISNRDPSYFIVAGLVFTTCCEPYLQSEYGSDYGTDSPVKILERLYHGFPQSPDEEVVLLSQVLACDATLGYEEVYNVQLLKFNGTPVRNLKHLAELVIACKECYMRFDLEYNEVVVIETKHAAASTTEVMASHSVPFNMSADLRKALPAWPTAAAALPASADAAA